MTGTQLDQVVVVIRQSPDWAALARDHAAGRAIDPRRFQPPRRVPDFPADIAELIAAWNACSAVDFFTCRARLKAIAGATLEAVAGARIVPHENLPAVLPGLDRYVLFFCDDDDWFAPDLLGRLRALDLDGADDCAAGGADVAVFPFVRFGRQTCSFVHAEAPPPAAVGPMVRFPQRYHTNNYALRQHICRPETLLAMQDHFDASAHGNRVGLTDRQFGTIVGATNKTPCAASYLRAVVTDGGAGAAGFAALIAAHVAELRGHAIPPALAWMRAPLEATIALFDQVAEMGHTKLSS